MRPEILTMTNVKGVRLDGAGGGVPILTKDVLNAAESYCNPLGLNMLLHRVCGDEQASKEAYTLLQDEIVILSKPWKAKNKQKRLADLSALAIFETNSTPVCPACKGRKVNRLHKTCTPCKGSGKYLIRDSHRARAIDVEHSTWSRVWSQRYTQVLQLLNDKENQALRELNKRIGRH